MNEAKQRSNTQLDKIDVDCRERKRQTTIEGWCIGILGAIAIGATSYASFHYSG